MIVGTQITVMGGSPFFSPSFPRGGEAALFSVDVTTPTYVATVVVWVVAMLGWLAFVIRAGERGLFLKHTRRLSNLLQQQTQGGRD